MGRNIWQSEHPVAMIQAARSIIHGNSNVEDAYSLYKKLSTKNKSKKPNNSNQNKSKKPNNSNQNKSKKPNNSNQNKSKKPNNSNQNKSKKPNNPNQNKK